MPHPRATSLHPRHAPADTVAVDDPGPEFIDALKSDELEALVETMYLVAFADGDFGEEERAHFHLCVDRLTGGRLTGDAFEHLVDRVVSQLATEGHEGCVAAIKQRLPTDELRQIALILASDMALADGILHPAEREVVAALASSLGIDAQITQEILEGPGSSER